MVMNKEEIKRVQKRASDVFGQVDLVNPDIKAAVIMSILGLRFYEGNEFNRNLIKINRVISKIEANK